MMGLYIEKITKRKKEIASKEKNLTTEKLKGKKLKLNVHPVKPSCVRPLVWVCMKTYVRSSFPPLLKKKNPFI